MVAIDVKNICKQYRLGEFLQGDTMLREALVNFVRRCVFVFVRSNSAICCCTHSYSRSAIAKRA